MKISRNFLSTVFSLLALSAAGTAALLPSNTGAAEVNVTDAAAWKSLTSGDSGVFSGNVTMNAAYGQLTFSGNSASVTLRGASGSALVPVLTNAQKLIQLNRAAGETGTLTLSLENLAFKSSGTVMNGTLFAATTGNAYLYNSPSGMTLNADVNNVTITNEKVSITGTEVVGGAFHASYVNLTGENFLAEGGLSTTGGVIYASKALKLDLHNAVFQNNSAKNAGGVFRTGDGGAVITGSNITFRGNTGGSFAGVGYLDGGDLRLSGSNILFENNRGNGNVGGALNAAGNISFTGNGSSVTFRGNTDKNGANDILSRSGSVYITGTGSYAFGGGISSAGNLEISDGADVSFGAGSKTAVAGTFAANQSVLRFSLASGSVPTFSETLTGNGNAVIFRVEDASAAASYAISGLNLSGSASSGAAAVLASSAANSGKIAYITSKTSAAVAVKDGSASPVWVSNNAGTVTGYASWDAAGFSGGNTLILTGNVSFSQQKSMNTAALTIQSNTDDIRTIRGSFTTLTDNPRLFRCDGNDINLSLVNIEITGIKNEWAGGAVRASANTVTLTGSRYAFTNNVGGSGGAAVYAASSATILGSNVTFSGNNSNLSTKSPQGGAAVWSSSNGLTVSGSDMLFENNKAGLKGGALLSCNTNNPEDTTTSVRISGNRIDFIGNTSGENGGAIYAQNSVYITAANSTFQNNAAAKNGGAVYAEKGSVSFTGSDSHVVFSGNTAGADGLGDDIYVQTGNLTFTDAGTYTFNGGVYVGGNLTSDGAALRFNADAENTINGMISLANTTLQMEIFGSRSSRLDAGGTLSLTNTDLELYVDKNDFEAGEYTLLTYDTAAVPAPNFSSIAFFDELGNSLNMNYAILNANGVYALSLSARFAVPEPSAFLLSLFALPGLYLLMRKPH